MTNADAVAASGGLTNTAPYLDAARMPAQRGEIPSLDGLRAGSILLVMCGHFIDGKLFPGGLGVLVFFVISGFLITRLLIDEVKRTRTIKLGAFYLRRLLRLYPVIVVYVAVTSVVAIVRYGTISFAEVASALFYYANYYFELGRSATETAYVPVSIFWSLAIEEHFYIVFPLLLLLLVRDPRRLLVGMAVVMVLALAFRLRAAALHPDYLATHYFYFRTEMRMDTLATGVAIAALCELEAGRALLRRFCHPAWFGGALAAVLLCLVFRNPWFRETLRYSVLNIAVAVAIAAVLFSDRYPFLNRALNTPVLVSLGRLSYSLYVWHLGVSYYLDPVPMPFWPRVVVLFAVSLLTAYLSYIFIEAPFMRLRHRFGSIARQPSPLAMAAPTEAQRQRDLKEGA